MMRLSFGQDTRPGGGAHERTLHDRLEAATHRLRELAREMIGALETANRAEPNRIPKSYVDFYRGVLARFEEIDLDEASALDTVQDLSTKLMDVHEAVFAMYFDPARTTGKGGMTAPMALN